LDDEVIIYIPFYFVTDKIIPPTWLADSEYNDYHAVNWKIAWIFKIVRSISSAQMHDSPPVKQLHFKQWDPGMVSYSLEESTCTQTSLSKQELGVEFFRGGGD